MKVTLISHTPKPLYVCAEAASVCYRSEPNLKIIKGCIRSGHTSVLEHATFTFRIEGISRSCSHQLVRHRIASYSQESQRYVQYDDCDWAVEDICARSREKVVDACNYALNIYKEMLEDDIPSDDARAVLPNAAPTTIYVTMNIRSLMNFFNERLCARASKEIRDVAYKMKNSILIAEDIDNEEKAIFKTIFVPKCEKYSKHFCPEIQCCGKHPKLNEFIIQEKGHWIDKEGYIECTNCKTKFDPSLIANRSFCQTCGANMIGE